MKAAIVVVVTFILVGCASNQEKPPRFVDRVQFMQYDKTPRIMMDNVEMLESEPDRPFKVIALLTCEGAFHEEIVMTKAIQYKARQLGADAAIRIEPFRASNAGGSMYGFHQGVRCLFRAKAIVYN